MKKRIIATVLALVLCAGLATPAFAAGDTAAPGRVNTVSLGGDASAAITEGGNLYMWGLNRIGQLGLGDHSGPFGWQHLTNRRASPTRVPTLSNVAAVSVGGEYALALTAGGHVYSWGFNHGGTLGYTSTTFAINGMHRDYYTATPTRVPGLSNIVTIEAGGSYNAAITANGDLYTWGQLISGDIQQILAPRRMQGLSDVRAVSVGSTHAVALTAEGNLYAWGADMSGQLGFPGTQSVPAWRFTFTLTPTRVPGISDVIAVSAGFGHTTALTASGHVYTWGSSWADGLGRPVQGDYCMTPTRVPGLSNVVSVAAGGNYGAAITAGGNLYVWGNGRYYQLGFGDRDNRSTPTRVPGLSNVASISLSAGHSAALTADGNLYLWGMNSHGTVGDGTTGVAPWHINYRRTPIRVMTNVRLPGSAQQTPPSDEPSRWAREQVAQAINLGLVPGNLQSSYTRTTTRAEFAALAVTLYETVMGREITERRTFVDTNDINVEKAAGIDVVRGIGNNRFDPNGTLTREQAATMLARLAEAIGRPLPAHTSTFADSAQVSSFARSAVGQVQAAGIMDGVGSNLFSPRGLYTREQSIVTILRLHNVVTDPTWTPPQQPPPPPPPQQPGSHFEAEVFHLVNSARANHGLPALVWHGDMADVARAHSRDMVRRDFRGNICPDGRGPEDRLNSAGIPFVLGWQMSAVALGGGTAQNFVDQLMASPGHRPYLLHSSKTHFGVGLYGNRLSIMLIQTPVETPPPQDPGASQFELDVLRLVNVERVNHGLPALTWHSGLADVARAHSRDMVHRGFFGHTCPSGTTFTSRIQAGGISSWATAENIARGLRTPERAVEVWMNSPLHRANILSPVLTHLGVGIHNYYVTQKFIG